MRTDVEEAGEHRSDDDRGLPSGDVERGESGQTAGRRQVGGHRPQGGVDERPGGAEGHDQGEDRPRESVAGAGVPGETDGARGLAEQAGGHDAPSVVAIGEGAGDGHEQHGGQELGEAEQPEVEIAMGEVEQQDPQRRHLDDRGHAGHGRGGEHGGHAPGPQELPGGGDRLVGHRALNGGRGIRNPRRRVGDRPDRRGAGARDGRRSRCRPWARGCARRTGRWTTW